MSASASPSPPLPAGLLAQRREREQQAAPALPRPAPARVVRPEGDEPEPVAAAGRGVPDRERDSLGDVGLAPLGRAERHRRRGVEDEPRHEHALGELDADVRLPGARGDVPVDPADVVAGLVRAAPGRARCRRPANAER